MGIMSNMHAGMNCRTQHAQRTATTWHRKVKAHFDPLWRFGSFNAANAPSYIVCEALTNIGVLGMRHKLFFSLFCLDLFCRRTHRGTCRNCEFGSHSDYDQHPNPMINGSLPHSSNGPGSAAAWPGLSPDRVPNRPTLALNHGSAAALPHHCRQQCPRYNQRL